MPLQLFAPTFRVDECLKEIRECLEKGWTGLGFKTVQFEKEWCAYTKLPHAHFLNSATSGLHLAVKILKQSYGWNDYDEIISTPITFISTNHAISYENLHITFADVDQFLCLDPDDVEKKITPKTRAIVFVGLGGNTGQWPRIVELSKKYHLRLILDAAHMAGTRLDGKAAGNEADAIVYSFQAVKNLPTADGGMICFKEKEHDLLARKLSWLGINKDTYTRTNSVGAYKWEYDVEQIGYKYHGNSIMASIALAQLRYLDIDNSYRRQIAAWYDTFLADKCDSMRRILVAPRCESSRHLYIIEHNKRDEIIMALNNFGIYPGVHYKDNTTFRMYNYAYGTCPHAHETSKKLLSLPMHLQLTYEDVENISSKLILLDKQTE